MKIKKIDGTNFKCHENLLLHLDDSKTQFFVGENGRGKTSALEMIKYAISGELPENPINQKHDYMVVETVLESGTNFLRERTLGKPSKVRVNGKATTAKSLSDMLERETGISNGVMKIVSSEDLIENMKPDEFSDFIMSYTPEELDIDKIIDFAGTLTPEAEKELRAILPPMPEKFSVKEIKNAYNESYEMRKAIKAVVAEKKQNAKIFTGEPPTKTMDDLDEEIKKINTYVVKIEEAKKAESVYKQAESALRRQNEEIEALKKEIANIAISKPVAGKDVIYRDQEEKLLLDISRNKTFLVNQEQSAKIYRDLLNSLDCDICPLCEEIKCTTDKSKYKKEMQDNLDAVLEGIEMAKDKISDLEKELAKLRDEIKAYSDSILEYNRKISLIQQLNRLEKTKISLPQKSVSSEDLEFDGMTAEEVTARIADLKKERNRIFEYEQSLEMEKQLQEYTNRYKTLNELTEKLSSKGDIMDAIIDYYLIVFDDICNEKAEELKPGFRVVFKMEDGVQIECLNGKTKDPIPYNNLSSGEKGLVIFLLMNMLNKLSGLKIMILDNLEKLDIDVFASLLSIVMDEKVQDEYDHIILSSVNHEDMINEVKKYPDIKICNI